MKEQERVPWYEVVDHTTPLTQGDLITDCPLLGWKSESIEFASARRASEERALKQAWACYRADVVVMTQACDLEQGRVQNVILCPAYALTDYRSIWEQAIEAAGKAPNDNRWKGFCDNVLKGFRWNLALLNLGKVDPLETEHRLVDFSDVHAIPRAFVDSLLERRGVKRLRLLPPYREHLSQAFARFFMRVGLPTPIESIPEPAGEMN